MTTPKPHFLLFCDGNASTASESANANRGRWKFVLENVDTGERTEATDIEPSFAADRCALVCVLRGLEALEQPSRVTLVTTSRYVTRGLQYGLTEWRDNDFSWEHFGAVQPIRNADIWRRIDRTLSFHQVQCRWMSQEELPVEEHIAPNSDSKSPVESQATVGQTSSVPVVAMNVSSGRVGSTTNRSVSLSASTDESSQRRTSVSSPNKHQRIYVDTPIAVATAVVVASPSQEVKPSLKRAESPGIGVRFRQFRSFLFSPIRFAIRFARHTWHSALVLDEFLESFLRCMLLLEPFKRKPKQKN